MVKENLMPKTETVYEINNEIQSVVRDQIPNFGEFMKTYESDGSLNYDDLKSGGLGEGKGYGPCSEGGCSYSDSECQCYIGQRRVPLYLVCPVPKFQPPYYCSDTTAGQ